MQNTSLAPAILKPRKSDQPAHGRLYGKMIAPAAIRPFAVVEVIIGMMLVVGCCYLVRPADPLLLEIGFPWLWLVATVFALRYGAILGVLAGLCVAAAWFLFYGQHADAVFPTMLFVGGMTQLIVTGHFCDV